MSPRISASKYLQGDEFPPDETSKVVRNYFLMLSPPECFARYRSASTFRQQNPNDICSRCFFLISALLPSSQLAFDHQTEIDVKKSISTLKALSMSKRDSRGEEKSSSGNINRDQDRRTESNDFFHIILSRTSRMSLIPERGGI